VTDLDRIYATILDRPDDDFPRLAYADALEEQAGTVTCQQCGGDGQSHLASRSGGSLGWGDCPTCRGSGEVSNGFAERAEFVRVQVELARMPAVAPAGTLMAVGPDGQLAPYNPDVAGMSYPVAVSGTGPNGRYHELRRRELELAGSREIESVFAPIIPDELFWTTDSFPIANSTPHVVVRRGFVDEARCDLRTWCGGECEWCGGDGQSHLTTRSGGSLGWGDCPDCHGTGRVTGIGPAVVRAHPVRSIVITGAEPRQSQSGLFHWAWENEFTTGWPSTMPDDVIRSGLERNGVTIDYQTRTSALDALSAALIAWAKSAPV
jgi:uncharacterized protein (TIGR02996 family)